MKYCNTCGEVYASRTRTCSADGTPLIAWDGTSNFPANDSQITSVRQEGTASEEEHTSVDTNVEVVAPRNVKRVARGKHPHGTASHEVGEHTDIIIPKGHETLTDFNGAEDTGSGTGNLVVYDDEVAGPFKGMLVGNRYRLEEKIGSGAFGVVFDAYDKDEDRRVAIKLLSAALCDDKRALTRFRREAIAASRIQHRGIVGVLDFGIQDEGQSYIVMEFLDGRDLATILEQEGRLSPGRAANIVEQCARALGAAHDAGVLHRDLKPANIFVTRNPDHSETVKILDFGIAKDRSSNPRLADLTSASKVVGTPYYMAPEQAQGHEIDARADVYSLGVILYELLTGTRPFEGASVYEILLAHVGAPRLPPSKVRSELARDSMLDSIVLRSIDADAAARFPSMHHFADALEAYVQGDERTVEQVPANARLATEIVEPRPFQASRSGLITNKLAAVEAPGKSRLRLAAIALAVAVIAFFSLRSSNDSPSTEAKNTDEAKAAKPVSGIVIPPPPIDLTSAVTSEESTGATEDRAPATNAPSASSAEEEPTPRARNPQSDGPRKPRRPQSRRNPKKKRAPKKTKGIEEW